MSYFANEQIANCDARTTDDDWYDRKDYSRPGIFSAMESQRAACQFAARPMVAQSPAERAFELVARLEIAKQHADRPAFDAAKAELAQLVGEL